MNDEEFRKRLLKPLDTIHNETRSSSDGNFLLESKEPSKSQMTLMKYISNPTGKGSAYVANRSAIKNGLNLIYIKLLREFRKHFYAVPYIYPNGDILFYVKVPSEQYKDNKIAYDVLFLLQYDNTLRRVNRKVEFYSNSPSFVFTYCYVYNKENLLIEKLKSKFPIEALTIAPDIRNPVQSLGYEKSTYIAARYLIDGGCLTDEYINRYAKTITPLVEADILRKIADPDLIVSVYQHAQYKKRKEHRKELDPNEKRRRDEVNKKFAIEAKKSEPKTGFIFQKAPRSKITARKAKRNLLNDKK